MRRALLPFSLAAALTATVSACGDDGSAADDAGPSVDSSVDAAPGLDAPIEPRPACTEFTELAGTIDVVPGSFDGDLNGAGADLSVNPGLCADQRLYFPPIGLDQVVRLTGLEIGTTYVLRVTSAADLSFYVATDCQENAGGPGGGDCLLFSDQSSSGREAAELVAAATSVFVVVDNFLGGALDDGSFTLAVEVAECVGDDQCSKDAPRCLDYHCGQCASGFDCASAGAAACDVATTTCVVGFDACTGDDGAEPDDGPLAATLIAAPAPGTPRSATAAICNQPIAERDFYAVTLGADADLEARLAWTGGADLDVVLHDAAGAVVAFATSTDNPERFVVFHLAAGTYYLEVSRYQGVATAAAVPYTLTLLVPECEDLFACAEAGAPLCDAVTNTCVAGVDACTGDDADAEAGGDDGPAGSVDLTAAIGVAGERASAICNAPTTETDFFQVTVGAGEGLDVELSWSTEGVDLDVAVQDGTGAVLAQSFWQAPEHLALSYLPAGTYYVAVRRFGIATDAAAVPYQIAATRSAAQSCASAADCAAVYSTQVFRGDCDDGICRFLAGGGATDLAGPCDSNDDCASGVCSHLPFEADAAASVCTVTCGVPDGCADVLGAGFACTSSLAVDICTSTCTSDLDCGVKTDSATLDPEQPWDYLACVDGVCN